MPKYYAVYRVKEKDNDRGVCARGKFYDEHPELNSSGEHFMSFAADLIEELTDSQLESLKKYVGEKHAISVQKSKDWSVEQNEYGTIFLIEYSKYDHLARDIGDASKLALKKMRERYIAAKKDFHFNNNIIAPLTRCVNYVDDLRKIARECSNPSTEPPLSPKNQQQGGTVSAFPLAVPDLDKTTEDSKTDEVWLKANDAIKEFGGPTKRSTFYNRVKQGLIKKRDTGIYYLESSVKECKRTNP